MKPKRNIKYIELSDDASRIYDSWPWGERSKKTSEAIVQYNGQNNELLQRIASLEKRVSELESQVSQALPKYS